MAGTLTKMLGLGVVGIAVIVISGLLLMSYASFSADIPEKTLGIESVEEGTLPPESNTMFCSNNPSVDLKIAVKDAGKITKTGINQTVYVKDLDSGSLTTYTINNANSGNNYGYDTFANAIVCGHNVKIYGATTQNEENGINPITLTSAKTQEDPVYVDVEGSQIGRVKCRVFDYDANSYVYEATESTKGNFTYLNNTAVYANFTSSTNNMTGVTIGKTDTYHIRLDCKSDADTQYGMNSLLMFNYLTDSESTDWGAPIVTSGGVVLTDVASKLTSNDLLAVTGYEKFYDWGTLGDSVKSADIEFNSGDSNTNPDLDIVGRIVGTGIYLDDKGTNKVIGGGDSDLIGFQTDTTRTPLVTSGKMQFTLAVD